MSRALELAARGEFSAHPNPRVGCVIVRDGAVVGEGWHEVAGEDHAEIRALRAAGDAARGACAYVSLEPCAHHGKTPPCATALIAAGVARVVAAMQDPFPAVGGRGLEALHDAGIRAEVGLLRDEAERLNAGFVSRVAGGRPFLRLKIASSLDGATAMASGESRWITGPEARADVQKLRARSGAVMTGIGTVLADNPSLDVRDDTLATHGLQPLRVVLDSRLRMPPSATMLTLPGATLVCCTAGHDAAGLRDAGAEVAEFGAHDGAVNVFEVLAALAEREVNDVLVEAGPRLAGYLLDKELVDELVIYQAPHIMGSNTRRMFETPAWTVLGDRLALDIIEVRKVGGDTRITARPTS
ncbi:MAG: bifunctional diaminohydroxyphosphoribosylaminopyrimidine deaminase/5-amino-6-(5-phosphoribosylamino)uracil reductase RibD [Gammaproteobacteria bacterium]|nr:bifunctional diaminohydroxyphosphoribosylaminopyrimidine deaminase/5-amino-6-(5-phosphoribosylamino)uracil reductase RibD [Gammaproteobacteria bacterium]NNL62944.1 bifunctional diaminohydroxyphosphoribosylaminopyrimidine deaminase/5-amino-6-(5-phosphoribosylamino)uracil reductase RibD [Woeseiaceae bacterium]